METCVNGNDISRREGICLKKLVACEILDNPKSCLNQLHFDVDLYLLRKKTWDTSWRFSCGLLTTTPTLCILVVWVRFSKHYSNRRFWEKNLW